VDVLLAALGHDVRNVSEGGDNGFCEDAPSEWICAWGRVSGDLAPQLVGLLGGSLTLVVRVHLEVTARVVAEF